MAKKVLLTGAAGFVGKSVLKQLVKMKLEVTALVRPGSARKLREFNQIKIAEIDLSETCQLRNWLADKSFDCIYHIGALRGGRAYDNKTFKKVNITATEQFLINALAHDARLIFCSSVGVFGAIPCELPASNKTKKKADNCYHSTKIDAEKLVEHYALKGLNTCIVRPSITYGPGDYGFPYGLCKLVSRGMMYLPTSPVKMHMTNIETLSQAFIKLIDTDFTPGDAFIVVDKEPVDLGELVDFISMRMYNKKYSSAKKLPTAWFRCGEKIAKFLKNELWTSRFELLSRSWYYDVAATHVRLPIRHSSTIPDFKSVIDWYKKG